MVSPVLVLVVAGGAGVADMLVLVNAPVHTPVPRLIAAAAHAMAFVWGIGSGWLCPLDFRM